ncbi:Ubiquitin homeostasis protein lub1 [Triticum urartu]|uniref:Ubiquitin homeostasis protein lub1 n=1 Tax=Triticum urartu TaxID=4572 RepID=M8AWQ5_TRIUA|nr:Ubiquitin homeostasis protein lub1 [Triticum urartu]
MQNHIPKRRSNPRNRPSPESRRSPRRENTQRSHLLDGWFVYNRDSGGLRKCMREITAQAPGDRRGIDANGNPGIDQESSETAGKETLAHGLRARVVDALIRQFFSPRRRRLQPDPDGCAAGWAVSRICICGDVGVPTSSSDGTVRFWTQHPEKKCEYVLSKTLAGHFSFVGAMVWAPPSDRFPEGAIVSGGMDTLVLLWNLHTGEVVGTMKGHTSQVQVIPPLNFGKEGFVYIHSLGMQMPGMGILSASHDGTIKLWALTGQPLLEMIGHTSLVYSVDAHSSGLIASGSRDRSVKIWKDGICVQSIEHPGRIWDAKFLDNGDVVTACCDGIVRIWTTGNNRLCHDEELAAYRKTVGGLKLMDPSGAAGMTQQGHKSHFSDTVHVYCVDSMMLQLFVVNFAGIVAQTLIVREGHTGVAYSWNSKELKWDKGYPPTTVSKNQYPTSWRAAQPCDSIPEDIIIWEIIPRLPAKAFARCRAICRLWRHVLTSNGDLLLKHHCAQPSHPIASCMERSDRMLYDLCAFDPWAGVLSPFAQLWDPCLMRCIGRPAASASEDDALAEGSVNTTSYRPSVLFQEDLHFYPVKKQGSNMLMVFNTTAESFRWMSAPATPESATLFEMDGKLVLYYIDEDITMIDICVLQDYDNEVWEFKYKIKLPVADLRLSARSRGYISPVLYEKGGVLISMHSRLVQVDTLGSVRSDIIWSGSNLSITPYKLKQSLVRHTFFPSQPGGASSGGPFI